MKFEILIPIISVLIIYTARILELRTKRNTIRGPVKENLTFRLFVLSGTVMLLGGVIEFFVKKSALDWPTFLAGWLCAVVSFALRNRAIAALGKFWSLHVEIRDEHQFVRSGPFRFVRHPTYFSMILELLSGGLILNAFTSIVLVAFLFIPALLLRLKLEEAALIEKFGPVYLAYQRETPAIFPYKWPATK